MLVSTQAVYMKINCVGDGQIRKTVIRVCIVKEAQLNKQTHIWSLQRERKIFFFSNITKIVFYLWDAQFLLIWRHSSSLNVTTLLLLLTVIFSFFSFIQNFKCLFFSLCIYQLMFLTFCIFHGCYNSYILQIFLFSCFNWEKIKWKFFSPK